MLLLLRLLILLTVRGGGNRLLRHLLTAPWVGGLLPGIALKLCLRLSVLRLSVLLLYRHWLRHLQVLETLLKRLLCWRLRQERVPVSSGYRGARGSCIGLR